MIKDIVPGAPKVKFLLPKIKPPFFLLNKEENLEKEENKKIEIPYIQDLNNGKNKIEQENNIIELNNNNNKILSILDFYKNKNNLISSPNKSKISLFELRKSNASIETKSSEKDVLSF